VDTERRHTSATVEGGAGLLATIVRELDGAGVRLDDLALHRPTLDDVFLALTGRAAESVDNHTEASSHDLGEKEIA
jgi:ABC-2 type transport system ATP-binding protein